MLEVGLFQVTIWGEYIYTVAEWTSDDVLRQLNQIFFRYDLLYYMNITMVMNVIALAELNFPKLGNPHPQSELRPTSYLQCYLDEPDSELLLHFRVQVVSRNVDFFFSLFSFVPLDILDIGPRSGRKVLNGSAWQSSLKSK